LRFSVTAATVTLMFRFFEDRACMTGFAGHLSAHQEPQAA
jgi:hypothetical protein